MSAHPSHAVNRLRAAMEMAQALWQRAPVESLRSVRHMERVREAPAPTRRMVAEWTGREDYTPSDETWALVVDDFRRRMVTEVVEHAGPWPCRTCDGAGVLATPRDGPTGRTDDVVVDDEPCPDCEHGHESCEHCWRDAVLAVPDDHGGPGTRICESDECLERTLPEWLQRPAVEATGVVESERAHESVA